MVWRVSFFIWFRQHNKDDILAIGRAALVRSRAR
jgi:hypothetical protein